MIVESFGPMIYGTIVMISWKRMTVTSKFQLNFTEHVASEQKVVPVLILNIIL